MKRQIEENRPDERITKKFGQTGVVGKAKRRRNTVTKERKGLELEEEMTNTEKSVDGI